MTIEEIAFYAQKITTSNQRTIVTYDNGETIIGYFDAKTVLVTRKDNNWKFTKISNDTDNLKQCIINGEDVLSIEIITIQ